MYPCTAAPWATASSGWTHLHSSILHPAAEHVVEGGLEARDVGGPADEDDVAHVLELVPG